NLPKYQGAPRRRTSAEIAEPLRRSQAHPLINQFARLPVSAEEFNLFFFGLDNHVPLTQTSFNLGWLISRIAPFAGGSHASNMPSLSTCSCMDTEPRWATNLVLR